MQLAHMGLSWYACPYYRGFLDLGSLLRLKCHDMLGTLKLRFTIYYNSMQDDVTSPASQGHSQHVQ